MSPLISIDVGTDLKNVAWSSKPTAGGYYCSTVGGKASYWLIREKYCPGNLGADCFTGKCEFAKKYPGSGKAKPCLEFCRKMEKSRSITTAIEVSAKP